MFNLKASSRIFSTLLAVVTSFAATAQDVFPSKLVKLVVPFAPGGTADIVGRIFANELSKQLNQSVIVENKAGAGGSIGARYVADAKPDGYTLLLASSSTHAANPAVYKNLPYDAVTDFTPITLLNTVPGLLSIHIKVPASNLSELVALAKVAPNNLTYASSGVGGLGNLAMELFKSQTGAPITHVPYKGARPAFSDLIGGQVTMIWEPIPAQIEYVKSGQLKAIAVADETRSAELPDVPTFKESGYPTYDALAWNGLLGPKGLQPEVLKTLNEAALRALQNPELRQRFKGLGASVVGNSHSEFGMFIAAEVSKWKKVSENANIRVE